MKDTIKRKFFSVQMLVGSILTVLVHEYYVCMNCIKYVLVHILSLRFCLKIYIYEVWLVHLENIPVQNWRIFTAGLLADFLTIPIFSRFSCINNCIQPLASGVSGGQLEDTIGRNTFWHPRFSSSQPPPTRPPPPTLL